jgi:hypothetical protein
MMSLFTMQKYSETMPIRPVERPASFEFSFFTPLYFVIAKFMEFVSAEV